MRKDGTYQGHRQQTYCKTPNEADYKDFKVLNALESAKPKFQYHEQLFQSGYIF